MPLSVEHQLRSVTRGVMLLKYILPAVALTVTDCLDDGLYQYSLTYGIAVLSHDGNITISSRCKSDLSVLREGIEDRQFWALKLLDSGGLPTSGFLWGNTYWLGSYSQCLNAQDSSRLQVEIIPEKNVFGDPGPIPPFNVQFYVIYMNINTTQIRVNLEYEDMLTIGLCLPDVCTSDDLYILVDKLLTTQHLYITRLYNATLTVHKVKTMQQDYSWLLEPRIIPVILIALCSSLLMVIGTVYDLLVRQPCLTKYQETGSKQTCQITKETVTNNETPESKGGLMSIALCFSAYTNVGLILSTKVGPDSVPVIHGLRFLGMFWIIMAHTIFYIRDFLDNKPQAFRLGTGFFVQIISNATLSVDTFFFLSGFLMTYLYYLHKRKTSTLGKLNFTDQTIEFVFIVTKRLLRLTPVYLVVIGLVMVDLTWYSHSSLFLTSERGANNCPQYWWRNILYINNLFPRKEMCMSWSWYLSNDMQCFVIGTLLIILSARFFKVSVAIMITLMFGSMVITTYISYVNKYIPTLDQQLNKMDILYDPPWTRIGPYFIGMMAGYFIIQLDGTLKLNKITLVTCWSLAVACNLTVLFAIYDRELSVLTSAVYVGVSRTFWGFGLAWLMVACCTDNAAFIVRILSYPAWIPLSRLTYCAYLLNPLLINAVYLQSETSMHLEFLSLVVYFFGHLCITYGCAFIISLAFETPCVLIVKKFMGQKTNR